MLEQIIDGISIGLDAEFGSDYKIYSDCDVTQGLIEPCFFIAVLNAVQESPTIGTYSHEYPFDISYFPLKTGDNVEMHNVGLRLFEILEFINLPNGDKVKGNNLSYSIVDSVLHFKVDYKVHLRSEEQHDMMESVTINEEIEW